MSRLAWGTGPYWAVLPMIVGSCPLKLSVSAMTPPTSSVLNAEAFWTEMAAEGV